MTTRPDFNTIGSTVWACNEIVNYLKPTLEGGQREIGKVQTVERHIGQFDTPADVKRWLSNRDGGVRIAALRVAEYDTVGNRLIGNVNFVAYIFTAAQYGYEKDTRAEVITGSLVRALLDRSALPSAYSKAMNVRSDNLYNGKIDELGVAIWSVTWSQQWYLDEEIDLSKLDDFLTFGLKGEVAEGAPTIEGEVPLPQ
ncbi:hypothetical protein [Vibrio sp. McD22-P3]|uniref:hypothetical protein n=1 Tax=Vibrio sp. McD22-P3 TaxID=2724880 RepID=UPI001F1E4CF3|nr:hypothetical protein [Vibrio sp. McD22-P3]MCF4173530.1 hypothetical protein [Vibrio sp. McD22-P3]